MVDVEAVDDARVDPGWIVILNGTPRAGKTSIARAIQDSFDGVWLELGVDRFKGATPERYQPGIGLRPGGERPDLEPMVATLYRAMYRSIAAHSRLGINVVVDAVHHDSYATIRKILADCARQLDRLPALLVGVRCPIDVVMTRRIATWKAGYGADGSVPAPVNRWQDAVHRHTYDLELDTSVLSPEQGAEAIRHRLDHGPPPSALRRLLASRSG